MYGDEYDSIQITWEVDNGFYEEVKSQIPNLLTINQCDNFSLELFLLYLTTTINIEGELEEKFQPYRNSKMLKAFDSLFGKLSSQICKKYKNENAYLYCI